MTYSSVGWESVARTAGLEPTTNGLEDRCSNPLSYARIADVCFSSHYSIIVIDIWKKMAKNTKKAHAIFCIFHPKPDRCVTDRIIIPHSV
jgi:hypothetical protein